MTTPEISQIYFKTPTGEHFFQYVGRSGACEQVKLVTLHPQAPAIEMLCYEAGMFWAWGCIPATALEFNQALQHALEGLSAEPKPGKQLDLFTAQPDRVRRLDSSERQAS
ncbi:MAG: hypothetical protein LH606_15820 [Cytophagaceae bacterium]|nr:hypothetical protein [Cytophagaceae bacterium]